MAQSISQEAIGATGLPGATAASRHAGAVATSIPTSGSFIVGDFVVTQTGNIFVCTTAGSPGVWTRVGGSASSYDGYLATLNPTAWWKMNDATSSTTVADSSGNSYTGTVAGGLTFQQTGPITTTPADKAIAFNGTNGQFSGTMNTQLANTINGSFSVSFWANTSNWSASYYWILGMGHSGGNQLFQIYTTSGTSGLTIGFYSNDWSTNYVPSSGWHNIVFTFNASSLIRQLYVDGVFIGNNTSSGVLSTSSGDAWNVGGKIISAYNYWPGTMSEMAIFNYQLNPTQISNLYSLATA